MQWTIKAEIHVYAFQRDGFINIDISDTGKGLLKIM